MAEDTATAKPVRTITPAAASLSFAGAATFVVLLTVLHLIKPELNPSWHFISEYAIGEYGWIMVLAFLSLALSYVSLFVAIRSQLRTIAGRIGIPADLLDAMTIPTLVLVGGASPAWMIDVGRQLALSNGQHRVLAGQEHVVPPEVLVPVLRGRREDRPSSDWVW